MPLSASASPRCWPTRSPRSCPLPRGFRGDRLASGSGMSHGAIVTGTDGSDSATAAVRQAAELAASSGVALHVVSGYPAGHGEPRDAVRTILDSTRGALAGVDAAIHLHAEPGDPASAICAVAERVDAELIVVGNK